MTLELNAARLMGLFTPLWLLLGLSMALNWSAWVAEPINFVWTVGPPFALIAVAWGFGRRRWRLELTPTELIHHTLGRTERYDFARMGPLEVKGAPLPEPLAVKTLWFAWPIDAAQGLDQHASQLIGRRVLAVFGDHSAAETARIIEDWRKAHAPRP